MKHVIITGASKGLGFALAKQYVEEGAVVHTLSRSEVSLEDVNAHQVDISQLDQLEHVMTTIFDQLQGNVTELLLINNAGSLNLSVASVLYKMKRSRAISP